MGSYNYKITCLDCHPSSFCANFDGTENDRESAIKIAKDHFKLNQDHRVFVDRTQTIAVFASKSYPKLKEKYKGIIING